PSIGKTLGTRTGFRPINSGRRKQPRPVTSSWTRSRTAASPMPRFGSSDRAGTVSIWRFTHSGNGKEPAPASATTSRTHWLSSGGSASRRCTVWAGFGLEFAQVRLHNLQDAFASLRAGGVDITTLAEVRESDPHYLSGFYELFAAA